MLLKYYECWFVFLFANLRFKNIFSLVSDPSSSNIHEHFERRGDSYSYKCKHCGKIVANMRNHYLMHWPQKHFCPICGASRTRLDNLKSHCKEKHPEYNVRKLFTPTAVIGGGNMPFERSEFFNAPIEYFGKVE